MNNVTLLVKSRDKVDRRKPATRIYVDVTTFPVALLLLAASSLVVATRSNAPSNGPNFSLTIVKLIIEWEAPVLPNGTLIG